MTLNSTLALTLESAYMGFYAHAGFCAALHERGIFPAHVSGASAGAIIAAFIGAGLEPAEIKQAIFDPKFRWSFVEWASPLRGMLMSFSLPGFIGLSKARRTQAYLESLFASRIADLKDCQPTIQLAVANLTTQRSELVSTGPAAATVLASCAFPLLLSPVMLAQGLCMDGGVANSCPFSHFAENPTVHTVITHSVKQPGQVGRIWPKSEHSARISDVFGRAHQLITNDFQALHVEKFKASGKSLLQTATTVPRPRFFTRRKMLEDQYAAGHATGQAVRLTEPKLS